MNIVTDENVPARTVAWLRVQGHSVPDAREPPLRSADDDDLWAATQRLSALLVTTDRGFAARWAEPHFGTLIVCLRQPNGSRIHARVVTAMTLHAAADDWRGLLCVMRDQSMSTRRAPHQGFGQGV